MASAGKESAENAEGHRKNPSFLLVALGHLMLQEGNLSQARALFRESLQQNISRGDSVMGLLLDALAVLAVREGKHERASSEADFAAITSALGEERFAQLREEGHAMTTMAVLALAQEEN